METFALSFSLLADWNPETDERNPYVANVHCVPGETLLAWCQKLPNGSRISELIEEATKLRGNREISVYDTKDPIKKIWRLAMKVKYLISFAGISVTMSESEDHYYWWDEDTEKEMAVAETKWILWMHS